MTAKELRQKFRNTFNCYADSDNVVMAMDEDAAIEFAEAYAKEENEANEKQIAELKELLKIANGWKEGGFDEVGFQKRIKQALNQ